MEELSGIKYYDEQITGCGVKIDFDNKQAWFKYPNQKERSLNFDSKKVDDATLFGDEITKDEYENYKDKSLTQSS